MILSPTEQETQAWSKNKNCVGSDKLSRCSLQPCFLPLLPLTLTCPVLWPPCPSLNIWGHSCLRDFAFPAFFPRYLHGLLPQKWLLKFHLLSPTLLIHLDAPVCAFLCVTTCIVRIYWLIISSCYNKNKEQRFCIHRCLEYSTMCWHIVDT